MATALDALNLAPSGSAPLPGLVSVTAGSRCANIAEAAAIDQATAIGGIDYIFFRRFSDERSSRVTAYVVDNGEDKLTEAELAQIHKRVWLHGSAPLLYVGGSARVDVLSCARGPDFWHDGEYRYKPAEQIEIARRVSQALQEKQRRFSAFRLSDGTFWDDPQNFKLAQSEKAAHRRLISAVVEADADLDGEHSPVLRRLLLLTVLIKYLEDRGVFPDCWFSQCSKGAASFFDVLRQGNAEEVRDLLAELERKFNGDVFALPEDAGERLTNKEVRRFAELVEAKTLKAQRYLWEQYSFKHIPVEVLSHLYQRFAQRGTGAVFTPPFVASLMLDYAMPYSRLTQTAKILDPTCGSGVFLVGAFRRLVHLWRSKNGWAQPDVSTLKGILKQSIFGVEIQEDAAHLTAFNLALAVCDALQPNVIWKDLRFDKLVGTNLLVGDFFEKKAELASSDCEFTAIVGNPPFQSRLGDAARRVGQLNDHRVRVPDNQVAYLLAAEAMDLLGQNGRMCLLQPAGFLYNEKTRGFQRDFACTNQLDAVLDFTSIRNLYDGADPKTVALVATKRGPKSGHQIRHYTFRRTFSVRERIGFELDHYDRHIVCQSSVEMQPWIWRANLLGGGRLQQLCARLSEMPTLSDFLLQKKWDAGEGFIAGTAGRRTPEPWLTGRPFLPTRAFSVDGIHRGDADVVEPERFAAPRTPMRYEPPLALIKEHESLPCSFWNDGFLAYKHNIVGIHASPGEAEELRHFCSEFVRHRDALRAFCVLLGTQALVGKATAILKRDIEVLPWPQSDAKWDLSWWEKVLCEDVINSTSQFVRLGQNSSLLKERAGAADLKAYSEVFVRMLGSVYDNLQPVKSIVLRGLAWQAFCFGRKAEIAVPENWDDLHEMVYVSHGEALRTVRVLRLYERNVILIVKPDRLRYWIRSTAIRDADETLTHLKDQGY
jgi:N-6 DNA methylase